MYYNRGNPSIYILRTKSRVLVKTHKQPDKDQNFYSFFFLSILSPVVLQQFDVKSAVPPQYSSCLICLKN
jgi:hypothetical protein